MVNNTIIYGLILSTSLFENRHCLYIIPCVTSCSLTSKKPLRYLLLPVKLSPIRLMIMNGCGEKLICFAAKHRLDSWVPKGAMLHNKLHDSVPLFVLALKLRANGGNNSRHCWANNLDSYCALVGSVVQTDTTTPNNLACAVHCGKNTTHNTLETILNARAWPQQCLTSCANGSIMLCYASVISEQMKCWEQ